MGVHLSMSLTPFEMKFIITKQLRGEQLSPLVHCERPRFICLMISASLEKGAARSLQKHKHPFPRVHGKVDIRPKPCRYCHLRNYVTLTG
jgi:hypothetical protein